MDHNLKKLLVYFLENVPAGMNRTALVKFVYLFEYYYRRKYGNHFTDTDFIRYNYGPYDQTVVDTVSKLAGEGIVKVETNHYMDFPAYVYKLNTDSNYAAYDELTPEEQFIADILIVKLSNRTATEIANFSYATPPMREVLKAEEESGQRLLERRLNMSAAGQVFRPTRKGLKAARQRLAKRDKTRGSQLERARHQLEIYLEYQDLRDRTNRALTDQEEDVKYRN